MRLIDADALMVKNHENVAVAHNERAAQLLENIMNAPTIDAVEVVRCKDCAWYRDEERICVNPHCTKSYYGCRVREENFCSFGERRGEDDD